mmetsp:Transcript_30208/g.35136  ORF Transcript_30208/g.35136 Transcript_30208/m.35136 type:complete len:94 (+) Transcript_30208:776-1057(+)
MIDFFWSFLSSLEEIMKCKALLCSYDFILEIFGVVEFDNVCEELKYLVVVVDVVAVNDVVNVLLLILVPPWILAAVKEDAEAGLFLDTNLVEP